jgi:dTDP-4-dehydrorhamnose reductase
MSTLITGATGLLGTALVKENRNNRDNNAIKGIYIGDYEMPNDEFIEYTICDTTDRNKLLKLFDNEKINSIIHAAGIADTDICEKEPEKCYISNVIGTKNIIELACRKKAKLVYISTNAVFGGENAPYGEEDKPNPINQYGKIKLECELFIRKNLKNYLIIRPILMYGLNNPNERKCFFVWALEKLMNKEKINIVDDIFENPLSSYQCADIIWMLTSKDATGIYHIAGRDVLSRYEAVMTMAKVFSQDTTLVNPVSSEFFPDLTPRPKNTSYRTTKIESELGIKLFSFEKELKNFKKQFFKGYIP